MTAPQLSVDTVNTPTFSDIISNLAANVNPKSKFWVQKEKIAGTWLSFGTIF